MIPLRIDYRARLVVLCTAISFALLSDHPSRSIVTMSSSDLTLSLALSCCIQAVCGVRFKTHFISNHSKYNGL